ncbi:MAG: Asp-tRNA(Asn)/Glu-tRNA(Gln) amidotransferase subunit GatA [Candidatus Aenigmarchaeota archaeon]|nr:Asp-tRNA(Asn)/Glu-tRNA(Gln) amidotransferase subunit GatA [Candidatus Aenigmarchaeota archaeon]
MQVKEYLTKVKGGQIDLEDFLGKTLEKIEKIQEKYSPFITVNKDYDLKKLKKGKLFGLPISIKDNICTKDLRTTAGARILHKYVPPFDSFVTKKVKEEGAVILGKTTMDQFGHGVFSINTPFSIPKNPWDTERTCGGSSGGAGCLTSVSDFPHIAIGESTGGSISAPTSFTNTVGITPTYGLVSRWGLISYANSLDKIGTIAKTVEDASLLLSIIAGHDNMDSTSLDTKEEDYTSYLVNDVKGMKIGVPKEYFGEGVDEEIKKVIWRNIKKLESLGATYEECSLPHTEVVVPTYYIIAMCETSTNLAKLCGLRYGLEKEIKDGEGFNEYFSKVRKEGFAEEAKRRIIMGTYARMAGYRDQFYLKAMKVRTLVIQDFKKAFKKYDVLISPSMPILPPKFSEIEKLTPLQVYMLDILTNPPNLAGVPMISVPGGFSQGLPVGMHIIADHLQEKKMIQVAHTFEQNTDYHKQQPVMK